MAVEYTWANGARTPRGLSAQEAGEELERIRRTHGTLTPPLVVQWASRENSALHDAFEWNDEEAATEFRLEQARYLIRHVAVKRIDEGPVEPIRAFVQIEVAGQRVYEPTRDALADPQMRQQVLNRARAEMNSFIRKYSHMEEISEIIQEALRKVEEHERQVATS
jgi:hypothetical protein